MIIRAKSNRAVIVDLMIMNYFLCSDDWSIGKRMKCYGLIRSKTSLLILLFGFLFQLIPYTKVQPQRELPK